MPRSLQFSLTTFRKILATSMLKSTISSVAVSAFLLIVGSQVAKADPVVLGGTIIASSNVQQAISGSLQTLDQNGNPFLVTFSSQGGPLDFIGAPGTPVTFQAGIAGDADQGNAAITLSFIGTGPVIPDTNAPTLDLIGNATITFTGFACPTNCLVETPLFGFSGGFTGPVALHFVRIEVNGETRYQLQTATATFTNSTVPEPTPLKHKIEHHNSDDAHAHERRKRVSDHRALPFQKVQ